MPIVYLPKELLALYEFDRSGFPDAFKRAVTQRRETGPAPMSARMNGAGGGQVYLPSGFLWPSAVEARALFCLERGTPGPTSAPILVGPLLEQAVSGALAEGPGYFRAAPPRFAPRVYLLAQGLFRILTRVASFDAIPPEELAKSPPPLPPGYTPIPLFWPTKAGSVFRSVEWHVGTSSKAAIASAASRAFGVLERMMQATVVWDPSTVWRLFAPKGA